MIREFKLAAREFGKPMVPEVDGVPLPGVKRVLVDQRIDGFARITVEMTAQSVTFEGPADVEVKAGPHKFIAGDDGCQICGEGVAHYLHGDPDDMK